MRCTNFSNLFLE